MTLATRVYKGGHDPIADIARANFTTVTVDLNTEEEYIIFSDEDADKVWEHFKSIDLEYVLDTVRVIKV